MLSWLKSLLPTRKAEPEVVPAEPVVVEPPKPVDIYAVYRPLFDLLGKSEGTDKGDGYNETLSYGAFTGGDVSLVSKTLDEVDALQTKMLQHPKNTWNSSAVGRYQVVRTTLRKVKKALELVGSVKFDENLQDAVALHLLEGRGLSKYLAGSMTEDTFLTNMAKEWASIPTPKGTGFYGNQSNTPVTPTQVRAVLAEVKKRLHDK